jgi:hypothetical protein
MQDANPKNTFDRISRRGFFTSDEKKACMRSDLGLT